MALISILLYGQDMETMDKGEHLIQIFLEDKTHGKAQAELDDTDVVIILWETAEHSRELTGQTLVHIQCHLLDGSLI